MKRDFLHITDFTRVEIDEVLELSVRLKKETREGTSHLLLQGKTLAMIFQKPSARTRISFETGMYQLGGHALFLSPADIGMGKRETTADIARLFSRYNDIIMARVFDHQHILDLGKYAAIPVINGLTDFNHPCQVMSDIFTVLEHRGHLNDLKVVFVGDGNNVAHSWFKLAQRIPMELIIACPEGFEPDENVVKETQETGLSSVSVSYDSYSAAAGADVIYTDVWASMGQEEEAAERKKIFKPFQVNTELMTVAGDQAYFMHCLPAHRGDEVTDEVIDGSQSIVFDEAENRMHVQKAIMVYLMGAA
ncbi:MAG: ornithine carbamoyltransferase [Candidatus Marinimicrobia bacterium]|jgi:ornithine carbamoyltransferase|nr:ornithine carbamoyltransferase [Candidatus Neomarinimicrobiota bacterium]MDP6569025.1 ornithine carbamoyltransferase [Candidatus Neomarinimicrobiota bacterium]MDP7025652.1 ornithine carbamoyltransferase [Candidatus Neomarinimicrobiota bacterium]|tara:strand:- start:7431 stop:8348 length:918 start_codon:yes stop_codon:yes gene_type:complete